MYMRSKSLSVLLLYILLIILLSGLRDAGTLNAHRPLQFDITSSFNFFLENSNVEASTKGGWNFTSESGTAMLLDPDRTLWAAGWNARHTQYFSDVPPAITWTQDAEKVVEQEYRRLHFPPDCSSMRGYVFPVRVKFVYDREPHSHIDFPLHRHIPLLPFQMDGHSAILVGPSLGGSRFSIGHSEGDGKKLHTCP